jgi:cytochrome c
MKKKERKGIAMKKNILLMLLVSLIGVSPALAQVSEFQKKMMEEMQKKMMGKMGTATAPGAVPTSKTPTQAKEAKKGKKLFNDVALGTNGKSCGSCHIEGQKPLEGRKVDNRLIAFIQYCYEHAIDGQSVMDGVKLDQIVTYFKNLHAEEKVGKRATTKKAPTKQETVEEGVVEEAGDGDEDDSW